MAEAAFSEDGKYYSAISKDGRLQIWDTETNILKQEYTPDLHLSAPPSCLLWMSLSQSNVSQTGARRKSFSEETQCIALGTTNGKILIYSVSQAKIVTVLIAKNVEEYNKKITSLDWHRRYGLYSCNKANVVQTWDVQSSSDSNNYVINIDSKNKQASIVSAIKIIPHNQTTPATFLVTASWQVRVWRLHKSKAVVVKNLGHTTAPRAMLSVASLNDKSWLVEGSNNERLLSFWDVSVTADQIPQVNGQDTVPTKKQRKMSDTESSTVTTPSYNFVLEDAPKHLTVNVKEDGGTILTLAATTRSGVIHYYGHMLNGASKKPIKPTVTVQVSTPDAHPIPLQCCHLSSNDDMLIGYTNGASLMFEKVTPDKTTKTQVLIRGASKQVKKKQIPQKNEVNKVRADMNNENVKYVEPMGGVSRKRPTTGAKVEVPMESRLANLALDIKSRSKSAVNQNLTKLLVQALHSRDKWLIMSVLQKNDPHVALQTVSNLPADYVPQLLEQLVDMAARKTNLCAAVCTWTKALVQAHSALLLATAGAGTGAAPDHLTQLLAIFTHRRSHLCQLLNLKGRIDLTISQRTSKEDQIQEQEPLLDYNDTSSDEEMEVENYQSDNSEHSWNDEKYDSAGTGGGGDSDGE